MPLISIIIPIYKVEPYLKRCIDSLIGQTYRNLEIILVNDGSPDDCGSICDKYAALDSRVIVLHQENQGVSVARNAGLDIAKGEWISFVDGDDWAEPDMIEQLHSYAEESNCDICLADFFTADKNIRNNQTAEILEKLIKNDVIATYLVSETIDMGAKFNLCVIWAKLYRKALFDESNIRFVPGLSRQQDIVFNLYAYTKATKLTMLNKPVYHYMITEDSLSKKYISNYAEVRELFLNKVIEFFNEYYSKSNKKEIISIFVTAVFIKSIRLQFIHKDAPYTFRQRLREIKGLAQSEPYKHAINEVDSSNFMWAKRIAVLLLKMRFYALFYLFVKFAYDVKMKKIHNG